MSDVSWWGVLGVVVVVLQVGLRLVALGIIPGNRKPSVGMAWLLLILIEPFIGFTIFLLLGRNSPGRRRHRLQREANAAVRSETDRWGTADERLELTDHLPPYVATVSHLNHELGALPLQADNTAELISDYRASIDAMTAAVGTAEAYVHVEFYITAWDEMTDPLFAALQAATERGVEVRLLLDHLGSRGIPGYRRMCRRLAATDIEWHPMLPIKPLRGRWRRPDLRNHRKLLVVDGAVAFTGSLNLTEPGYNKPRNHALGREWVELMVRLQGPIVNSLSAVFATDWFAETGTVPPIRAARSAPPAPGVTDVTCQLVPSGPGFEAENNLRMFNSLAYSATRRLSIVSPYFVPDESLLAAVTTAAQRGVEVELFVSEVADQLMVGHAQASYYRALLAAGVTIHEYPAPYILHSKFFTVDDTVAVIGSSNMDQRSFTLNYEVSLMMLGPEIVAEMSAVQAAYREISTPLTLEEWERRPARLKYVDNVMRLTAALQ